MGVDELCLTWDDHHRTLIGVFETLLENGTLVDCTIAAEGQYLKAHKVILSSCSPYFEMLFTQESEKNPIVVLKDIKFQDLKALIDFIYRGKVQIPEDRLQDFTDAAESLQIKGLGGGHKRNVCEKKGRESPKALGKESFGRKRNSSSFPTTEENKTESTNATISNKSPRLENIDPNQMTDGSASLLPLSASDSPPTPPQREVQKESSETMPSTASQSATEPDLQPIAEVYVPETWIEPKSEVCEEEVSMDGSENGGEGAMLEGGEEYENFAFPSPLEVVKEESDNSVLLDPVSESSDPPGEDQEAAVFGRMKLRGEELIQRPSDISPSHDDNAAASETRIVRRRTRGLSAAGERRPASFPSGSFEWNNEIVVEPLRSGGGAESAGARRPARGARWVVVEAQAEDLPTEGERLPCRVCGRTFSCRASLRVHERKHSGQRPFPCESCGKAFFTAWDLHVHRRIHTGETPFQCHYCSMRFRSSSRFHIHMRKQHRGLPIIKAGCAPGRSTRGGHSKQAL